MAYPKNSTPMTKKINLINRNIQFEFLLSSLSFFLSTLTFIAHVNLETFVDVSMIHWIDSLNDSNEESDIGGRRRFLYTFFNPQGTCINKMFRLNFVFLSNVCRIRKHSTLSVIKRLNLHHNKLLRHFSLGSVFCSFMFFVSNDVKRGLPMTFSKPISQHLPFYVFFKTLWNLIYQSVHIVIFDII